jgi:hypothetical protein
MGTRARQQQRRQVSKRKAAAARAAPAAAIGGHPPAVAQELRQFYRRHLPDARAWKAGSDEFVAELGGLIENRMHASAARLAAAFPNLWTDADDAHQDVWMLEMLEVLQGIWLFEVIEGRSVPAAGAQGAAGSRAGDAPGVSVLPAADLAARILATLRQR